MKPKIDSPIKLYFYKYLMGGERTFNFGGVILEPSYNEDNDQIAWYISNPNNESFSLTTLYHQIDGILNDFSLLTDESFYYELKGEQVIESKNQLYFSEKDKNKFLELSKQSKTFSFGNFSFIILPYDVDIHVDSNRLLITVYVKVINPTNNSTGEKIGYAELNEMMDGLAYDDDFIEKMDATFPSLTTYIYGNMPNIFDPNMMYIQNDMLFYTDKKKSIKYW